MRLKCNIEEVLISTWPFIRSVPIASNNISLSNGGNSIKSLWYGSNKNNYILTNDGLPYQGKSDGLPMGAVRVNSLKIKNFSNKRITKRTF